MGLYRIPIQSEKIESLPQLMRTMGFPVLRTETQEAGICYFCANPKRPHKNWTFWITHEKKGYPQFFLCGLSQLSRKIVNSLNFGDIFVRGDAD